MTIDITPKFVSFDMNGTLIQFRINDAIRHVLGDRLPAEVADDFLQACKAYRIDECMGDYKPFHQIVADSMERASRRLGLEFRPADARASFPRPRWSFGQAAKGVGAPPPLCRRPLPWVSSAYLT